MPDDPLEALRALERSLMDDQLGTLAPLRKLLVPAIAAWEKERAERSGDAEGFAEKVDQLTALRLEVLKVAEEMEIESGWPAVWRARLRKACE